MMSSTTIQSNAFRRFVGKIQHACRSVNLIICVIVLPVSLASAKDLYVAPNGDNSLSSSANNISNPWKTILHGVYNLRAGDTLFIRGGTYTPKYTMVVKNDYANRNSGGDPNETMNAQSGTANNPVRITSYPGERAVINCSGGLRWLQLENKDYWEISNLDFVNCKGVIHISLDSAANYTTIRGNRMQMVNGGDNKAAIKLDNAGAEYTVIEGNEITGPGTGSSIHSNTSCIYLRLIKNVKIIGNVLSGAPIGIYYKHATAAGTTADTDIEIAYNYITNTGRSSLRLNTNRAFIHDNVFGANNANVTFTMANGKPGGDFNRFTHNTLVGMVLSFQNDSEGSDPYPGSYGNIVRDNLLTDKIGIHPWVQYPHDTELD